MTERPIIFSGPMVRAILEGRKTQTRRRTGLHHINEEPDLWRLQGITSNGMYHFVHGNPLDKRWGESFVTPWCVPGDRLAVRESDLLLEVTYVHLQHDWVWGISFKVIAPSAVGGRKDTDT